MKRSGLSTFALTLALTAAADSGALSAPESSAPLRVLGASVTVKCPLTVGGGFEAATEALSGEVAVDPRKNGAVDGTLIVDLRTLQTGINLRDSHMRENYLEVQKGEGFSNAKLSRIQLDGIDSTHPVGKGRFRGMLLLHGEEREVTGTAEISRAGSRFQVNAVFPVKVSDFNIASPTYLGVGVKNEVKVAVNFQAANKHTN
jgi:polyisoprenoid-binding protein YceI